jgi:hypothetical protein
MGFKVTNSGGSGSIVNGTIFSYTYEEQATSVQPAAIDGSIGSVSFSAIGTGTNKSGSTYTNTLLLINNDMVLTDDDRGSIDFRVRATNLNQSDVTNISGDTIQHKLNAIRRANAYNGDVAGAINYYVSLNSGVTVGYDDSLATLLAAVPAVFIGWEDNVWNKLKELCAVTYVTVSGVKRNIEMYVANNVLRFRLANKTALTYKDISSIALSVDSSKSAQTFEVNLYNTEYGTNKVYYEFGNIDGTIDEENKYKSTIASALSVKAGETIRQQYKVNATLNSVVQPVLVEAINKTAGQPYSGSTGEYVIMADDGLPVVPQQWLDAGGSLTVSLQDEHGDDLDPGVIEITLVGPPENFTGREDENGDPVDSTTYSVGIEDIYPAIWLVGTGVFYTLDKIEVASGASNSYNADKSLNTIDNVFITSKPALYSSALKAAQAVCGPDISLTMSVSDLTDFGASIGGLISYGSNKFRVVSASHSQDGLNITATGNFVTFADFDTNWSGKTFSNFDSVLTGLKFNEFSVIPLMESA